MRAEEMRSQQVGPQNFDLSWRSAAALGLWSEARGTATQARLSKGPST